MFNRPQFSTSAALAAAVGAALCGQFAIATSATWQNIGNNWTTDANWSAAYPKASGETATFPAVAIPVNPNLTTNISIGGMSIDNSQGDYSITAANSPYIVLNSAPALTVTGGGITNIAPELRLPTSRTFDTGDASVTLAGGLSFTGNYTLSLTNSSPLLITGPVRYQGATTTGMALILSGAGSATISGNIVAGANPTALDIASGFSGTLRLTGANSLAQANANTALIIRGGTLEIGSDGALNKAGGGTVNLQLGSNSGTKDVKVLTINPQTIASNFVFSSNLTNPSFTVGGSHTAGLSTYSGSIDLANNGKGLNLTAAAGGAVEFTGVIAGTDATNHKIAKVGDGIVKLSRVNTYAGSTTINAGALQISGAGSINASAGISIASNATFDYQSSVALTKAVAFTGTGAVFNYNSISATKASQGAIITSGNTLSGAGKLSAVTVQSSGTLAPGDNGGVGILKMDSLKLDSGSILKFNVGATQTAGADSDQIQFNTSGNNLLAGAGGNGALQLIGFNPATDLNKTYRIFTNVTTTGYAFGSITGYDSAVYTAQWVQTGSNYDLTIIPEPSAMALGLAGGSMLIISRRRFAR